MSILVFPADAPARSAAVSNTQGWRRRALCLGQDPEMWFPVGSGGVEAVAICAVCPVRLDCLRWALETNELDGIWGGVSARRRQRMRADARAGSDSVTVPSKVHSLEGSA
jgi:WhiB family transcriptional regulator, redox-sensing transcriptional regulator